MQRDYVPWYLQSDNVPMERGVIAITQKEATRYDVLRRVLDGTISLMDAAGYMGVSYRQAKRLKKKAEEGLWALAHGNRGRSAAHAVSEEVAGQVVELYKDRYQGFNFSHFHEKLVEIEGVEVCRSTVGRVLKAAGYGSPRKRRGPKHRSRRERRSSEGAMLQLDGSPHDWLEGRGPRLCLVGAIDDATGKVPGAIFREYEDAQGYFLCYSA